MISVMPIPSRATLPPGILYPSADDLSNPAVRRVFNDAAAQRLIVRVTDVALDDKGNARTAEIAYLANFGTGPAWQSWHAGDMRLCMMGYRIELRHTPRAGLHIWVGKVVEDSPVDANGYRVLPPTFVATLKIAVAGLTIVSPGLAAAGMHLPFGELPTAIDEIQAILDVAMVLHGATRTQAEAILAGDKRIPARDEIEWVEFTFDGQDRLAAFRVFAQAAKAAGQGILIHGGVSRCSHAGDIVRRLALPARWSDPAPKALAA
jgi:hypothetical protein